MTGSHEVDGSIPFSSKDWPGRGFPAGLFLHVSLHNAKTRPGGLTGF